MGLVISRASDLTMGAFCGSQGLAYAGDVTRAVYVGGPVQTERAFILHGPCEAGPETEEVLKGVFMSYSLESLRILAQRPTPHLRVFLGYAGWGPGQLADEVREGAWLVHEADPNLVFAEEERDPWQEALSAMGIEPAQLMHSSLAH